MASITRGAGLIKQQISLKKIQRNSDSPIRVNSLVLRTGLFFFSNFVLADQNRVRSMDEASQRVADRARSRSARTERPATTERRQRVEHSFRPAPPPMNVDRPNTLSTFEKILPRLSTVASTCVWCHFKVYSSS